MEYKKIREKIPLKMMEYLSENGPLEIIEWRFAQFGGTANIIEIIDDTIFLKQEKLIRHPEDLLQRIKETS